MKRSEIKETFESHFKTLAESAKKQCSGEDLRAITEAMIMIENKIIEY